MNAPPVRIASHDLGHARRMRDALFGAGAIVPLLAVDAALLAGLGAPWLWRLRASGWTALLLAFLAGVKRGLTFSEAKGGRWGELAAMFGVYALAAATLFAASPLLGAAGCVLLAVTDALAARRGEAPAYFAHYRPAQMTVAVAALVACAVLSGRW